MDGWGWKATAFRMLNIYGYHFNQNMNLHEGEHDADHTENVCLAYCAFGETRKIGPVRMCTLSRNLKMLPEEK